MRPLCLISVVPHLQATTPSHSMTIPLPPGKSLICSLHQLSPKTYRCEPKTHHRRFTALRIKSPSPACPLSSPSTPILTSPSPSNLSSNRPAFSLLTALAPTFLGLGHPSPAIPFAGEVQVDCRFSFPLTAQHQTPAQYDSVQGTRRLPPHSWELSLADHAGPNPGPKSWGKPPSWLIRRERLLLC